jgi:hypothetical protein
MSGVTSPAIVVGTFFADRRGPVCILHPSSPTSTLDSLPKSSSCASGDGSPAARSPWLSPRPRTFVGKYTEY